MMTKQPSYYRDLLEALSDDEAVYKKICKNIINTDLHSYYSWTVDFGANVIPCSKLEYVYIAECTLNFPKDRPGFTDTFTINWIRSPFTMTSLNWYKIKHDINDAIAGGSASEEISKILTDRGFSKSASTDLEPLHGAVGTINRPGYVTFRADALINEAYSAVYWQAEKEQDELDRKRMREL
jgi:hypothetical protein